MKNLVGVFVILSLGSLYAAAGTITGKVVSQQGTGLAGLRVDVHLAQVQYRTTTGSDGSFMFSGVTSANTDPLPRGYVVSANFPNPFNPRTRIGITSPRNEMVRIVVYNVLGERVGEEIERQCTGGESFFDIELAGLPNGVYIARVSIGETFSVARKMMLLYGTQHLVSDVPQPRQMETPPSVGPSQLVTSIDSLVVSGPAIAKTTFSTLPPFTGNTVNLGDLYVTFPVQMTKSIGSTADSAEVPGFKIVFGEGTFSSAASVHIVKDNTVPVPLDTTDGVYDTWNVFRATSIGDTLRKPARITLTYDPDVIPEGYSDSALSVVHFTSTGWEILQGGVNPQNHTITCDAASFSSFAVAVPRHKVEFPTAYTPLDQTITFDSETVPSTQIQSYDYSVSFNGFMHHVEHWWGIVTPPSAVDPGGLHGKALYAATFRNNEANTSLSYDEGIQSCVVFKLDLRSVSAVTMEFDYNCQSLRIYDYFVVELTNRKGVSPLALSNWAASWVNLSNEIGLTNFWGDGTWRRERFVFPQYLFNYGGGGPFLVCGGPLSDEVLVRIRFHTLSKSGGTYPTNHAPFVDNVIFRTTPLTQTPAVSTTAVSNVGLSSATGGGSVTSQGGSAVSARGVCWSTFHNPTVSNSKTVDGSGTGSFVSAIAGLLQSTTYYARAYATNIAGTSYGNEVSFTTGGQIQIPVPPTLVSPSNNSLGIGTYATLVWVPSGGATSYRLQVATTSDFSATIIDKSGLSGTSHQISGLLLNVLYYWRVNATNSAGTSAWPVPWSFTTTPGGDTGDMVLVEGGTFVMGTNTSSFSDQRPAHPVTLNSFWIDKYEVTVAQYRGFCTATSRAFPTTAPSWGWNDNDPMLYVSWHDASAYASWVGKRLPTEAEWEFAARGGKFDQGFTFSGSGTIGDVAWYSGNSGAKTHAIGTKMPNELGLYDMTGNAVEWCSDWVGAYPAEAVTNPTGPSTGSYRVFRGGAWNGSEPYSTVYYRSSGHAPGSKNNTDGFRCARSY